MGYMETSTTSFINLSLGSILLYIQLEDYVVIENMNSLKSNHVSTELLL